MVIILINRQNVCELLNEKDILNYGTQCNNGGTCFYDSKMKKMKCECVKGFSGDRCQVFINHCQSNPCKYGSCLSREDTYKCECSEGWQGENCDQEKNMCDMNENCEVNNTRSVKYSYSNSE